MPRKRPSGEQVQEDEHVKAVERAMVAIRRSQTRRALTRLAEARDDTDDTGVVGGSAVDVLTRSRPAPRPPSPASRPPSTSTSQGRANSWPPPSRRAWCAGKPTRPTAAVRSWSGPSKALPSPKSCFRRSIFATAMSDWTDADRMAFARLLTRFVDSLAGMTGRGGKRDDIQD